MRVKATPSAFFAALGGLFLAGQLWIFIRWAADGNAHPVPSSASPTIVTWALQAVVLLLAIVFTGVVVRQSRRAGHVTFDAALLLGYFLSFWQSPLINYEKVALVVSHRSVNVTTWGPYIPGWDGPSPRSQAETLLGISGVGFIALMTWMWSQAWLTGRIARRHPDWTWGRLLPASLPAGLAVAFLLESIWMNTGFYSYTVTSSPLTPLHGHWFGPHLLYYAVVTLFISTPAVMIRHDARTRGADPYIFRGARSDAVRLLAGVGLANLLLLTYFVTCVLITQLLD